MAEYMADYGWLGWILIGLIAGAIARAITPGPGPGGCLMTILLGIAERWWPDSSDGRSAGTRLAKAPASSPPSSARC